MLFSLIFSSLLHAEEPASADKTEETTQNTDDGNQSAEEKSKFAFEAPAAKVDPNVIFKSPGYVERPLRPTTHPKDRALSSDGIENFQRIYINERNLSIRPVPGTEEENKESLPIVNRTTAWVDISISNQKIGRIGPLTTGVIHGVQVGEYDITYTVEHMQYAFVERVKTHRFNHAVTPGNINAGIANAEGYQKPFFDTKAAPESGKLVSYVLPKPPPPPPEENPEEDLEGTQDPQ